MSAQNLEFRREKRNRKAKIKIKEIGKVRLIKLRNLGKKKKHLEGNGYLINILNF